MFSVSAVETCNKLSLAIMFSDAHLQVPCYLFPTEHCHRVFWRSQNVTCFELSITILLSDKQPPQLVPVWEWTSTGTVTCFKLSIAILSSGKQPSQLVPVWEWNCYFYQTEHCHIAFMQTAPSGSTCLRVNLNRNCYLFQTEHCHVAFKHTAPSGSTRLGVDINRICYLFQTEHCHIVFRITAPSVSTCVGVELLLVSN